MSDKTQAVYTSTISSKGYSIFRNNIFLNGVKLKEHVYYTKPPALSDFVNAVERELDKLQKAEDYLGEAVVDGMVMAHGPQRAYIKLLNLEHRMSA